MVSIARSSLLYEWRRYLAAVLSVTFAGLLMLVQVALLQGLFQGVSTAIDKSSAQIWIGFPNTLSVDLGRATSRHADALARIHPAVQRVERYTSAFGDLRRANGVAVSVAVNMIDTRPSALAFSEILTSQQRAQLDEPDAVMIDVADLSKFDMPSDASVEINGKRAHIVGIVEGIRAVGGVSVITSSATGMRFDSAMLRDEPTFFLVSLKPGADAARVAREIADVNPKPRYSVWTAKEFSEQSQRYWLLESGVGIGAGFSALLALTVGVVITSQTLAAAILASLKEFAALRALGVSHASLRAVVLELATWVGVIGLGITTVLTLIVALLADTYRVAMAFTWWSIVGTVLATLLITTLSGLYALRPLFKAEPANLLR